MQFTGHSLPVHQSMSVPREFFTSSHFISQFPPMRFPLITAIRMCHLLPVHHLGMAFWPGQRSKYNIYINTHVMLFTDRHFWYITTLFSVARYAGCFKLGLKHTQLYITLSILPLSHQATYVSLGIITHYISAFICLHFALTDTGVLNSLQELCITQIDAYTHTHTHMHTYTNTWTKI